MHGSGLNRLRAADRLRRASEFDRVFRCGTRVEGKLLKLVVASGKGSHARLGLAVGRRAGGAVQRNRAKRLLRESFRSGPRAQALDIVVLPKGGLLAWKQAAVAAELARLVERARRRLGQVAREGPAAAGH